MITYDLASGQPAKPEMTETTTTYRVTASDVLKRLGVDVPKDAVIEVSAKDQAITFQIRVTEPGPVKQPVMPA